MIGMNVDDMREATIRSLLQQGYTGESIARMFKISPQRVSQIKAKLVKRPAPRNMQVEVLEEFAAFGPMMRTALAGGHT